MTNPHRRRSRIASAIAVMATLTAGCATTENGTLSPIWGPYSERQPVPVLSIEASVTGPAGELNLTTPEGSPCVGTWSRDSSNRSFLSERNITGGKGLEFFRAWSTYSGGSNLATGTARCSDGTTFSAEFLVSGNVPGAGIAVDSNGNVYRVAF